MLDTINGDWRLYVGDSDEDWFSVRYYKPCSGVMSDWDEVEGSMTTEDINEWDVALPLLEGSVVDLT